MSHEQFNLDRHLSIENMVDPTGKKWIIKGERGSALVHARPEPDRSDYNIPKEFSGKWTSPTVLKELMDTWLNRQWDHADRVALAAARKRAVITEAEMLPDVVEEPKQTPEESLAGLDPEIAAELGETIAIEEPEEKKTPKVTKKKASKKKAAKKAGK